MLYRMNLLVAAAVAALAACGPATPAPGPADAAADATPDATPDVAADVTQDAAPDATQDVAPDAAPDDVALDVTPPPPDATPDAPAMDAAPDGPADAPPVDAAPDATALADVAPDAPAMDARADAALTCSGDAPLCVMGMAGGECSDALTVAHCEAGAWRCNAGEVLTTECACLGRPPGTGCTCGSAGWVCPDGGASDAGCSGRPASCVSGTPGGQCGDAVTAPTCTGGAWTCPPGQFPVTECVCVGRPPGPTCTCGAAGWVCPDAGADAAGEGGGTLGTACAGDGDCASGLLCCTPCSLPSCRSQCTGTLGGRCPLTP
jgi:hypothetical protein